MKLGESLLKIDCQDVSRLKLTFTNKLCLLSFLFHTCSHCLYYSLSKRVNSFINDIGERVSNEMIWEEIKQKVLMNETQLRAENSNETK